METITIEIGIEKMKAAIGSLVEEVFKSSYNNPVKNAIEAAVKEKEGAIKKVVDEIIVDAISNPEFKKQIADNVIQRMVESAIKR